MATMPNIGKLEEVDVRDLWEHEQYDFSNWLAQASNLEYLNDILGLTLTDVDKETYVGPFRCDLVAKDETSGTAVIIENQLEETNHDHLGKIITYASGLDAKVVVWIVRSAKEEHRSAIEWLNNNTTSDVNFFLIEIHAYKIGDSDPAPKFEVVEQPNDFVKRSKNKFGNGELSKLESEWIAFWEQFKQILIKRGKPLPIKKTPKSYWYNISCDSSEAHISICLVNRQGKILVQLYIDDNKELFDSLFEIKEEIKKKLGFALKWERLNNKKASIIIYEIPGLNFDDHANYEALMNESIDVAVKMRDVFKQYL